MGVTEAIGQFVSSFDARQHDAAVTQRIKLLSLDLAGGIIRAGNESDSTPALRAAVADLSLGAGNCTVLSDRQGYSPGAAALLNGVFAHSLDFDDTHAAAILHPGAAVMPAAWAAAQGAGASGADTISAIIAGYEVALRLALALPAGEHYNRGFHPSATCGAFGATAAACRALGLDAQATVNALGIVLSQAAGSLQFLDNGSWTKRFQVGWASMSGLMAALLAARGFSGASAAIEGKHGFLNSHAPAPEPERILDGLGTTFTLMDTGIKPYPSCRWGHAGIDAALTLRAEHSVDPDRIVAVRLGLSRAGMLLVGEPEEKKQAPTNTVEAQFSGPFVIASALLHGNVTWDSYRLVGEERVMGLCRKVAVWNDPDIEREFPRSMSASVEIVTEGGRLFRKVVVPKGDPANFPSQDDIMTKYLGLVGNYLPRTGAESLARNLLHMEEQPVLDLEPQA